MKALDPAVERAICHDYEARGGDRPSGPGKRRKWRYSTDEIAMRNSVTQWTVNLVRLRNGLWRNQSSAVPRTAQLARAAKVQPCEDRDPLLKNAVFRCPHCQGRSSDSLGHTACRSRISVRAA